MIIAAFLLITVSAWLAAPTFGSDPTIIGMIVRVALAWLIAVEVALRVVPE